MYARILVKSPADAPATTITSWMSALTPDAPPASPPIPHDVSTSAEPDTVRLLSAKPSIARNCVVLVRLDSTQWVACARLFEVWHHTVARYASRFVISPALTLFTTTTSWIFPSKAGPPPPSDAPTTVGRSPIAAPATDHVSTAVAESK